MPVLAPGVAELTVSEPARTELAARLDRLAAEHRRSDDPRFLAQLPELAAALPPELRAALAELRSRTGAAVLVVRGGPVAEPSVPTPAHWRHAPTDAVLRHDLWLALLAGPLGQPMCWANLQDGRSFQDVLPIAGEEGQQTGHGSRDELAFHVEDCFSDDRCDLLALIGLRNRAHTPTTVATAAALDPAGLDLEALAANDFRISPDPEHLRGADPRWAAGPVRPVLSATGRSAAALQLRVDPAFSAPLHPGGRAAAALAGLHAQLSARLVDVALEPGDVLLVDNRRAVHGRAPFRPSYDGNDRWLRKLTVSYSVESDRTGVRVVEPFPAVRDEAVVTG
jgi:L-asparagine oxygenase